MSCQGPTRACWTWRGCFLTFFLELCCCLEKCRGAGNLLEHNALDDKDCVQRSFNGLLSTNVLVVNVLFVDVLKMVLRWCFVSGCSEILVDALSVHIMLIHMFSTPAPIIYLNRSVLSRRCQETSEDWIS